MLFSSVRCSHMIQGFNFKNFRFGLVLVNNCIGVAQSRPITQGQYLGLSHCLQINTCESSSRKAVFKLTTKNPIDLLRLKDTRLNFSSTTRSSYFWKMGDRMSQEVTGLEDTTAEERPGKIKLTEAEWKAKLTPEEYSVCRNHGTERAWTGALLDNKKKGIYTCTGCGTELFSSASKFESGSGWPSFYDVLKDKDVPRLPAVDIKQDRSYGMQRTEVLCGKCSSHLGHVFNDGPQPTGLRYCMNSVALKFKNDNGGGGSGSNNNNKNNL